MSNSETYDKLYAFNSDITIYTNIFHTYLTHNKNQYSCIHFNTIFARHGMCNPFDNGKLIEILRNNQ